MATDGIIDRVQAFLSRTRDRAVAETRFLFEKRDVHIALKIFGVLLMAIGLPLVIGGAYLLSLGGSWYYLAAGLGLAASGLYFFRGLMTGVWIYLAVLSLTVIWALAEVGLRFWPLAPRLVAPLFLAGLALLLTPLIAPTARRPVRTRAFTVAGAVLMAGFVAYLALMFQPHGVISNPVQVASGQTSATTVAAGHDWYSYGRTGEGARFAPFDQINRENVSRLEVAWVARTGFIADQSEHLQDQNTPLYVDGTVYHCASGSQVTALDGVTGAIRWQFDPQAAQNSPFWKRCRTLGYFDPGPEDVCGPRILLTTVDSRLIALRASDGEVCETFGEAGAVDLSTGMGQLVPGDPPDAATTVPPLPGFLVQTTGPFVAGDRVVLGAWVADNVSLGEPSGAVRAYDARTGRQVWAWDLGNPAITNLPPEGETYTVGTPNVWSAMSFDLDLNMIYLPLGNATPDYYGGQRRDFDDDYNASIVALNIDTGREVWHFNTVNHDIWDYDVPSQPNLADLPDGAGGTIPVVIQTTKRGQIFVLDRRTGVPVRTVEERAVQGGDGSVQGEYYSATQPYSTGIASISAEPLSEQQMWGATPLDQMLCRILFRQYRYAGDFTAQSVHTTIIYPGNNGGINWGGASVDQQRNILVTADMRMPVISRLIPRDEFRREHPNYQGDPHGELSPQFGLPYANDVSNFMSPLGIPCLEPPWGSVTAVDLNSGQLVWQQPAGTSQDVTLPSLGIQTGLGFYVGMPALGGPITTGSGLTFHGGTQDYYLRAYDTETGRLLWRGRLPTGAQSTPMTYIGADGRQYVVVSAGGARYNPNNWGDYVVAFALPRDTG